MGGPFSERQILTHQYRLPSERQLRSQGFLNIQIPANGIPHKKLGLAGLFANNGFRLCSQYYPFPSLRDDQGFSSTGSARSGDQFFMATVHKGK